MNDDRPKIYKFWPQSARDRFDERIAIMREANKVPDTADTPPEIIAVAKFEADQEVRSMNNGKI